MKVSPVLNPSERLKQAGLRPTRQRLALASLLFPELGQARTFDPPKTPEAIPGEEIAA